ncbi:MAG: hypothetical protein NVSMB42_09230 [Herpetosiphon sp.]
MLLHGTNANDGRPRNCCVGQLHDPWDPSRLLASRKQYNQCQAFYRHLLLYTVRPDYERARL